MKYKIGHYYQKDYYRNDRLTKYTIIKLKKVMRNNIRGEIVTTNMKTRYKYIGKDFGLYTGTTDNSRIHEVTIAYVVAHAL